MILKATPSLLVPFNCTATGITKCHGKCCTNLRSYWPVRVYQPNLCPHLTETGCVLSLQDRPIDCLLYPLFINGNGTLVIHNHCFHNTWMCHENIHNGPPLVEALKECLVELFGNVGYSAIKMYTTNGKKYTFQTTPEFTYCRMVEDLCIKYDLPIMPRSQIVEDFHNHGNELLELMEEKVKDMPV